MVSRVPRSSEWARIASLPRRPSAGWPEGAERLEEVLRRPGVAPPLPGEPPVPFILRDVQRKALAEILTQGGALLPIRVGGGKTLITYLAGEMVEAARPVLLVPAKLRDKTRRDFAVLRRYWLVQHEPVVLSYEMLGHPQHACDLDELRPDLILADEAHRLKNPRAAVTRRVGRWFKEHPKTRFVALSGTMTKRSLYDFSHLAEWALGADAPVPLERRVLDDWARALDEDSRWAEGRMHPGVILELEGDSQLAADPPRVNGVVAAFQQNNARDEARRIYQRRMAETPGVVVSSGRGVEASLGISRWDAPPLDPGVQAVLLHMRSRWQMPDGQELEAAVDLWRHARELAQGFWYRWREQPPDEWLDARRDWSRFVRETLSHSRTLDSPAQVAAAHRDNPAHRRWVAVRDSFVPVTEPIWLTESVVDAAIRWAERTGGLVWVEHKAVGELFQRKGLTYFGQGGTSTSGMWIDDHKGPAALSIAANSEGRNLQRWSSNLVLSPPTTGDRWEQLLGRTHREGQTADEVACEVYLGVAESQAGFEQALSDAAYQQRVMGFPQKLLLADMILEKGQENGMV